MAAIWLLLQLILVSRTSGASLASTPPRGWNSYDSFSWIVSEDEFLANAKAVADTLLPFGYEYAVVDFLWFRKLEKGASVQSPGYDIVDEWGRPVPDPQRWPSTAGGKGFAPIAEKVHSMGLKFGIHVMRGISSAAIANNTAILGAKGWRAKDIALTSQPCPWMNECFFSVNTSSDGGKAFIKSMYDQYASWGVDFVKHDCVFGADNINLEEIKAVSRAIAETGRPIIYSLSPGVQATPDLASSVSNIVHMYRVTGDDWDRWADVAAHFDVASNFARAGLIGAPGLGGGKSWPDLDMLPLGWLTDPGAPYGPYRSTRLSSDEQKSQLSLWAMVKSPLMYGGDLRHMDEATYSMITNPALLEINSYSSMNKEYYAGSPAGTQDFTLLSLGACDDEGGTKWSLGTSDRLCWTTSSGTEPEGCFKWTLTKNLSSSKGAVQEGFVQLWTSDSGDSCLDSHPNIITSIDSKSFLPCSLQNSQEWTLLSNGTLQSKNTNLCAVMKRQPAVRIWLAQGSKGQRYVAFFNLGQNATQISYSLASEQDASEIATRKIECNGKEVWSRTELESVDSLSATVPSHGCALFSLVCSRRHHAAIANY